MATKVYREHGAFRQELYQLQRDGLVELINFPYEMRIKKKHQQDQPSKAKLADLKHVLLAKAHWRFLPTSTALKNWTKSARSWGHAPGATPSTWTRLIRPDAPYSFHVTANTY